MSNLDSIKNVLKNVIDPEIGINIVDLNMVKDIQISDKHVDLNIALTVAGCPLKNVIKSDVEKTLLELNNVQSVEINFTVMSSDELQQLKEKVFQMKNSGQGNVGNVGNASTSGITLLEKKGIRNIIAIVSGKGGVGKSFTTALLASELKKQGYEVGVLDADVTGPSIPKVFGLQGQLVKDKNENGVIPLKTKSGIKVISMNLMDSDPTTPYIWRGPIITGIIRQLFAEVDWGDLHFLLIDLPPGTSDAPLTVFQSLPIDAAILVSTPQELASLIVSKSISMSKKLNVPIIGLIENMSYMICEHCNKEMKIYGKTSLNNLGKNNEIDILGAIPFDPKIVSLSDKGKIDEYNNDEFTKISHKIRKYLIEKVEESKGAMPIAWNVPKDTKSKSDNLISINK